MKTSISRFLLIICSLFLSQQLHAYDVTSGQSGSWFDPTHDGEGYFLQVLNDTQAAVFWFSYDTNGNQYWMAGVGSIVGSKITFPELTAPFGGKFGPDFDPDDVEYPVWGSLEFDFSSCDTGTAVYSGPAEFGSGSFNLTRLSTLWGLDCQGNDTHPQSSGHGFLNGGFSGSWFDFAHDGEGFVVEVLNETLAVVIWFTYDTEGNPAWMFGVGEVDGASIVIGDLNITSGGVFGPGFDPDKVVYESWGPAAYTFGSCGTTSSAGNMRYIPPDDFGPESSQLLYRLTLIQDLPCDFLTDTYSINGTMSVAENIFIDGDVNDPNVPETSNDLEENFQQLVPPAKVAGFATAEPTGNTGDRFADESDVWDVYSLAMRAGESISVNITEWNESNPESVDIDLYLVDVNDPDFTVDSSLSTGPYEWVTAPADGNYFIFVEAYAGTSNYLLRSGQTAPAAATKLTASSEMVEGELITAVWTETNSIMSADTNNYRSRVEKTEKDIGLSRIAAGGNGEILYAVDTSRIDRLVPHPLTQAGWGSITPEDWQVIKAAKTLSASKDFRWAGPNYVQKQMATPNDPFYGSQWHYPQIRLPQAWDTTTGSASVVVAVIDTGVSDHPDLVANVDYSLGYDFVQNTLTSGDGDGIDSDARDPGKAYPTFTDYVSHGTHVAGTVGATGNNGIGLSGVNWDVTIMPLRVLGTDGSGDCWAISQAMQWAGRMTNASGRLPAKQADIINMSLGGASACPGAQNIVNSLVSRGIVVVAAAGNESSSVPNYPASLGNVISVSATTFADELAPYSSYGANVDVAAPGGDNDADLNHDNYVDGVLSTAMVIEKGTAIPTNSYVFLPGTSMASPHIAGVAALMKSVYPAMGTSEFFSAISSGSITADLSGNGAANKDNLFGYGRIDAQKAVNWAVEQNQGQPGSAFLTSSISSANFGSSQQSISFNISKSGSGTLSVTGGGTTEAWVQLYSVSTDASGLGSYRVAVDRNGLVDGSYSGWAGLEVSDGSIIWISVVMQIGEKVAGEAGYLYALLLDSWTYGNVKQWDGASSAGEYPINLGSNPPGAYFLMVGSDIDNDRTVCDQGEFCQIYPLNNQASEIIVSNGGVQLGSFVMSFPEDVGDGNVSSNAFETGSPETDAMILEIISKIGTSGVPRNR